MVIETAIFIFIHNMLFPFFVGNFCCWDMTKEKCLHTNHKVQCQKEMRSRVMNYLCLFYCVHRKVFCDIQYLNLYCYNNWTILLWYSHKFLANIKNRLYNWQLCLSKSRKCVGKSTNTYEIDPTWCCILTIPQEWVVEFHKIDMVDFTLHDLSFPDSNYLNLSFLWAQSRSQSASLGWAPVPVQKRHNFL